MTSFTLDDAEQLHRDGYVPIRAHEVAPGDRCATKAFGSPLSLWSAIRCEPRTFTPLAMGMFGEARTPTERTVVDIWCEFASGAVLVETYDHHSIIYVNRPTGETP
jgi:hypothetical protein